MQLELTAAIGKSYFEVHHTAMSRSVPLWVGELTGPAVQYDARTQQYRLAAAPSVPALRSARVLGVCVKVSNAAPAQSPQFPHQLATQLEIGAQEIAA